MADESRIDSELRDAFARAAEPGEPAGVADVIRSRIAAGEQGITVAGNTAPGFHAGWLSPRGWVGLVAVVGLIAGGLGISAVFSSPDQEGAVTIDQERPTTSSAPAGEPSPEITMTATPHSPSATPTPEATRSASPTTTPVAPPQADTTRPVLSNPAASENPVYNVDPTTISVTASDDKRVTSVIISWEGQFVGSALMSPTGSTWVYTFTPPTNVSGEILFRMVAKDAAGNVSSPAELSINHYYFG